MFNSNCLLLVFVVIFALIWTTTEAFRSSIILSAIKSSSSSSFSSSSFALEMGLGDMLKKAMANDPSLPPAQNAGLSASREKVEVEFLPSGDKEK